MLQILIFLHSELYLCFDLCDDFLFSGMAVSQYFTRSDQI